ncbi:hypothetical protein POTOM_050407 [Populus tomentosa]|uniref:Uncharacterized protein n=1 Tax=Populus tomentosa TaxID=118781 RepID=A0A8X8C9E8_POPTO|nr:hypothetical protein POTOM_050407 [Populus tomentosa]
MAETSASPTLLLKDELDIVEAILSTIPSYHSPRWILGPKASCISFKDSACSALVTWFLRRSTSSLLMMIALWLKIHLAKKLINALQQHIKNLLAPSTPFSFNTLYDPYREGTDFVRGYPFSLREGVPTAVSHGLWLNIPDYDAPTQLVKPLEKNTR